MGSMAASGGYYISTAADKIFATPETLTGSLGVIMESVNYSKLADKLGISFETIKSGAHKDIMSPSREMTKEEKTSCNRWLIIRMKALLMSFQKGAACRKQR